MNLQIITECDQLKYGGLSRYEKMLIKELKKTLSFDTNHISKIKKPSHFKQIIYCLSDYFYTKASKNNQHITHLLNQQLALSLNFLPLSPVIVTVHDLAFIIPKYYKDFSIIEKIRYKLVMRGLKRADYIVTDAEFTKKEIINYLSIPEKKITVIPLGIDNEIFRTLEKQKNDNDIIKPFILYVGSEIKRMNIEILIRAIYLLRKDIPTIKFIKIGSHNTQQGRIELLKLITGLNMTDAVEFVENISDEELARYYNSATVFVYPIEYTGYGLPCLEAMACGCPVITTSTSTLPEVVGDAALLFEPDDVITLKKHLHAVITDKSLREQLIDKGLKRVKQSTWEQSAKKTIEFYTRFLNITSHSPQCTKK